MSKERKVLDQRTSFVGAPSAENLAALAEVIFGASTDEEGAVSQLPTEFPEIGLQTIRSTTPTVNTITYMWSDVRTPLINRTLEQRSHNERGADVYQSYEKGLFIPTKIGDLRSKIELEQRYGQFSGEPYIDEQGTKKYWLHAVGTLVIAEADIELEGIAFSVGPKSNRETGHEFKAWRQGARS